MNENESIRKGRDLGIPAGIAGIAGIVGNNSENIVFQGRGRHGFAGENANHPADVLSGKRRSWSGVTIVSTGPTA